MGKLTTFHLLKQDPLGLSGKLDSPSKMLFFLVKFPTETSKCYERGHFHLEYSFSPSHPLLEVEQTMMPENPCDSPDILRDHKTPYQLSARGKTPREEQVPVCSSPVVPPPTPPNTKTTSFSPLENICLNRYTEKKRASL